MGDHFRPGEAADITKGPLSRRVSRLEAHGLLQTRAGTGGTKLVNVAQFLKAVDQTGDLVKEANGAAPKVRALGNPDDLNLPESRRGAPRSPPIWLDDSFSANSNADLKQETKS